MAGILLLPLWVCAQGVNFRPLSYAEAMELAAKENKMIFIDFYTTWCGPCKRMSKEVFPQQEVGEYFNRTFISLKLDAEKENGLELARKYAVKAFPAFVVLSPDGTEVFRTSGYCPADEFVEKIRKGIDPRWSPAGLAKRYGKGERTPRLVNDYATLLLEQGKTDEGFGVINDYFNRLSARKKVKPENLFLFEDFALGREFLFDHKEAFVKNNGRGKIDSLMCRWLRFDLMPFICLRAPEPVSAEGLQQLKERIAGATLADEHHFDHLLAIAEMRVTGDNRKYLERCKEKFPLLDDKDRFSILLNFSELRNESPGVKTMAAALIGEYLDIVEGINRRILKTQMLELEGKKEYSLRVELEGAEKGKLLLMSFSRGKFMQDTLAFEQGKIELDLAGTDTLDMTLCIMGEGLEAPTASSAPYYPRFSLLMVPGEFAVLKVKVARGKIPVVEWVRGGEVSHDYVRLTYEQAAPDELAYRQLSMDNIIRGGDIREYKAEFDAFMKADRQKVMDFVRNNPGSYITLRNLMEHYIWFDENEMEEIYHRFPEDLKKTSLARALKRKLEKSSRRGWFDLDTDIERRRTGKV